jgi:hypothetical protein
VGGSGRNRSTPLIDSFGADHTGSGGGGGSDAASYESGGLGGTGIVMIRYPIQ